MNEYVYSPMKAAHTHRDIKVYKIDRGQNYTQRRRRKKNYIELTKVKNKVKSCFKLPKHI